MSGVGSVADVRGVVLEVHLIGEGMGEVYRVEFTIAGIMGGAAEKDMSVGEW